MHTLDYDEIEIIETTNDYKTKVKTTAQLRSAITWIVTNHQYLKINGTVLDGFTASAMNQVLNALNDENQEKFLSVGINKGLPAMANITYKLIK